VGVARRADDRRHVVSALISRFATCTATANGWTDSADRRVRRRLQGWMSNGCATACFAVFGAEPSGAPAKRALRATRRLCLLAAGGRQRAARHKHSAGNETGNEQLVIRLLLCAARAEGSRRSPM
jgi:hypothetical protein